MDNKNSHLTSDDISDDILFEIAEIVKKNERRPHIDNPEVIESVDQIYDVVKALFTGYSKIEKVVHEPFHSMAYIELAGKKIECKNGLAFYELRKCVDNVEVYYRTNGTITITFTFHDVTKFVDD